MSHLEAGRRDPSLDLLRRMAEAFGIPDGVMLAVVLAADLPDDKQAIYEPIIKKLMEISATMSEQEVV